jgi:hypothetical protein
MFVKAWIGKTALASRHRLRSWRKIIGESGVKYQSKK